MKKRRAAKVLLAFAIMILVFGMIAILRDVQAQPVRYAVQNIVPEQNEYCPGDTVRYEVTVIVENVPSIVSITETWCRVDGFCANTLSQTWNLPLTRQIEYSGTASRKLPESPFFVVGIEYELTHATTAPNVDPAFYTVGPFKIKEDCP